MRSTELEDFTEALEALVSSGATQHADGPSIEALHRCLARLESFVTEATSAFESGEKCYGPIPSSSIVGVVTG